MSWPCSLLCLPKAGLAAGCRCPDGGVQQCPPVWGPDVRVPPWLPAEEPHVCQRRCVPLLPFSAHPPLMCPSDTLVFAFLKMPKVDNKTPLDTGILVHLPRPVVPQSSPRAGPHCSFKDELLFGLNVRGCRPSCEYTFLFFFCLFLSSSTLPHQSSPAPPAPVSVQGTVGPP